MKNGLSRDSIAAVRKLYDLYIHEHFEIKLCVNKCVVCLKCICVSVLERLHLVSASVGTAR